MDYMSEYKRWLDCSALSADEHAELAAVADNQEEIESRFFAPLSFGTAGLRGVLGVGLNRMNRFTVGQAAQGLANLIVSNGQAAMDRGVAIAYDSRHFSAEFAKQSACIMAANGIQSLLFDELRPTRSCPSLSVTTAVSQASTSRFPQPEGVQRLQGILGGRRTASSGRGRRGCQRNGQDGYLHRCKNCRLR